MRIVWRLLQSRVLAAFILGAALVKVASDGFNVYAVVGVRGVNLDVPSSFHLDVLGEIDIDLGPQKYTAKDGKVYAEDIEIRHSGIIGGR